MPIQVLMPALSPTMTEGKLAKWLKAVGDPVQPGDVIAEIETDKATMEVEAVDEGIMARILIEQGVEGVPVNTPIAVLLEDGEDASAMDAMPVPASLPPAARPDAQAAAAPAGAPGPSAQSTPASKGNRIFASPLAKRIAADAGLDLAALKGSGPRGRIVKRDVEQAVAMRGQVPEGVHGTGTTILPDGGSPYIESPNSTMRKVIARRLSDSKREIPHYYLTIDCMIDELLALREKLNSRASERRGRYKLTVNDFVVKSLGFALKDFPEANCSWTDEAILYYQSADVCVAVATPNGLVTPIIRNADGKGLAALSNEIRALAARAKDGKLMPEEYQGGTFTVSNLGMFGIREFSAIINPPQSGLLAVGAAEQRPVVKDGALAVATMMTCTLSADHRSVDGAVGAQFLQAFKQRIEDPLSMLL